MLDQIAIPVDAVTDGVMIYCQPERKRSQGSRSGERQDCAMSGLRHQPERPWPAKVIEKKVEVTGRDANGKIDHGRAGPATLTNKLITCFCGGLACVALQAGGRLCQAQKCHLEPICGNYMDLFCSSGFGKQESSRPSASFRG